MPTYEYACTACAEHIEVVQSFTDASLTECPSCAGRLRKVFSPVGVVFKGSGFYKTDSRDAKSKSSAKSAATSESKSADTSGGTSGSTSGGDSSSSASADAGTKSSAPATPATGSGTTAAATG